MNLTDLVSDVLAREFPQDNRPVRLRFAGRASEIFDDVLVPQCVDISEALCDSTTMHVTCLSTRPDLPLVELKGLPIEVAVLTDVGGLKRIPGVITSAIQGECDGALTPWKGGAATAFS